MPVSSESTSPGRPTVLVVDDEIVLARALVRVLDARGFAAHAVEDGREAITAASAGAFDVVLLDLRLGDMSGLDVMAAMKKAKPEIEVVIMTAHGDVDTAVAAVRAGAYDFVSKPFPTNDAVAIAVSKALEHKRLVDRTRELEHALEARADFGEIVGASTRMQDVYRLAEGVATATSTVLILGESGTGKELVARAIHQRSTRAAKSLVVVNCGAIPSELVESELFGHVKGAFTGATMARQGLFEAADRGTIFLDEVGDLPLAAQVKLLRVLQEGEIKRVGSNESRTVDVRVIAATNVDLRGRIRDGRFREDLFYRLNVISIVLPALRDRREDIALLASHFVQKYAVRTGKPIRRVTPEAVRALESQPWPGNVRELENAMERAVVLARGDSIGLDDVPRGDQQSVMPPPPVSPGPGEKSAVEPSFASLPYTDARRRALIEFEREYVDAVLRRADGNISRAARTAGLDRSNFKRVLRRAQIGVAPGDADDGDGDER